VAVSRVAQSDRRAAAVFLDKDGTVVDNIAFNADPERITLAEGAAEGLYLLVRRGYRIVIVSNQPGVALGIFPEHALRAVEARLRDLLRDVGVPLSGFYYCPHLPEGTVAEYAVPCTCRKPASGLLFHAAREHAIDLARSWMVGDILDDIEAGHGAGCRTVLIDNGNETEWDLTPERRPHKVGSDLFEAAALIVSADTRAGPAFAQTCGYA
jgi:D-glycero-D-manno-heptose 1,7-bisphosphate phosphatase